ncbi:unnamed protein product [Cyprideis torosa]|uniref:Uncharacterized protein n=1 Tax=Cyprideis torosa TaxID=163714 RepID=A0A7R8W522_9CRUS|nr:unnamed protein product [Cyprideis torosa]CAG0883774.1 unnamed protein product [Cyprideis torosa]
MLDFHCERCPSSVKIYPQKHALKWLRNHRSADDEARRKTQKKQEWSPFSLSISELYSKVIRHPNPPPEFLNLIPLPMPYALQGIVTLGDILLDTQSMVNQEISLTVLVKQVGRPRKFSGKDGQEKSVLEVIVCDDSCLNFPLKLWELNVRVSMDNFRGTPCLSPGFHSIVTVDPDPVVVPRAAALLRWVKTVDIDIINADDQEYLNVNEIKEIYTLTQLRTSLEIAKHQASSAEASAGTKPPTLRGVLFATLVDFPIESHNGNGIVRKRCSSCQAGMAFDSSTCPKCESDTSSLYFALSVGLADCQGSLHGLQLKHTVTQNLLGWTPEQFLKLSPEERSDCKHSFHLQHVKAIFNVCHVQQGPRLSILQMELADPVNMLRILE